MELTQAKIVANLHEVAQRFYGFWERDDNCITSKTRKYHRSNTVTDAQVDPPKTANLTQETQSNCTQLQITNSHRTRSTFYKYSSVEQWSMLT